MNGQLVGSLGEERSLHHPVQQRFHKGWHGQRTGYQIKQRVIVRVSKLKLCDSRDNDGGDGDGDDDVHGLDHPIA